MADNNDCSETKRVTGYMVVTDSCGQETVYENSPREVTVRGGRVIVYRPSTGVTTILANDEHVSFRP